MKNKKISDEEKFRLLLKSLGYVKKEEITGKEIQPERLYSLREIAANKWLMVGYAGLYSLVREGRLKSINLSAKGEKSRNIRYGVLGRDIIRFRQGEV